MRLPPCCCHGLAGAVLNSIVLRAGRIAPTWAAPRGPPTQPASLCLASLRCRPQGAPKLLQLGVQYPRVVRVRAEWQPPQGRKQAGGWALKTKQERILMDV